MVNHFTISLPGSNNDVSPSYVSMTYVIIQSGQRFNNVIFPLEFLALIISTFVLSTPFQRPNVGQVKFFCNIIELN